MGMRQNLDNLWEGFKIKKTNQYNMIIIYAFMSEFSLFA